MALKKRIFAHFSDMPDGHKAQIRFPSRTAGKDIFYYEHFFKAGLKPTRIIPTDGATRSGNIRTAWLALLFGLMVSGTLAAQQKVRFYGYVIDTDNRGIELANVYVKGTTTGTTTNRNGYYDLQVEYTDSITLVYSMLGYKAIEHTLLPTQRVMQISVELQSDATALADVEIVAHQKQTSTMEHIKAENARIVPDATGGSIEALLITFTGVSQTNELSSQYSVRGGNFDENCVYVNGVEVYRPLLIRAGQQEGLSFVNPDMADNVSFSAGGFDAKYGDKMSSVLDITYKKPTAFESSLSLSLLGASAYVGFGNDKFTQMHGIRYKTQQYLLGTLDTKGTYKPNYVDYQTYMTYQLHPKWELTFLGNISQNSYIFQPDSSAVSSGTFSDQRKLTTYYDGQEKDMFRTFFGAVTLNYKPITGMKLGLMASGFYTDETETYDIRGQYWLSEVDVSSGSAQDGAILGTGTYHEHARNRLNAGVFSLAHVGEYKYRNHHFQWGASVQREMIRDRISEWEMRDSADYSIPSGNTDAVKLYYSMKNESDMDSYRLQGYVQDTYKWRTDVGSFSVTGGVRFNYWTFNHEFLPSPRVSFSYLPGWKHDFGFRLAAGLYYQSPFYKELRDTTVNEFGVTEVSLNKNIRAQRSFHVIAGGDYYFRAWGRPFKFTTEAYYKYADRVISYTIDNVRVRYSGRNDAKAYTMGVDFKLYGELVPGADSWLSLSFMRSREDVDYDDKGWILSPTDQRYNISLFYQDYLPNNPKYKLHLKVIFADGLPYGPPRSIKYRNYAHMPAYWRVDIGASRVLMSETDAIMRKPWAKHIKNIWIHADIFNLLNVDNVNSYYWVTTIDGQQFASPNYLTKIMFNVRLTVDLK